MEGSGEHLRVKPLASAHAFRKRSRTRSTYSEEDNPKNNQEDKQQAEHAPTRFSLICVSLRQLLRCAAGIRGDRDDIRLDVVWAGR